MSGERPAISRYTMMLPTSREEGLAFVVRAALAVAAVFVGLFIIWTVREALLLFLLAVVFATVLIAAVEVVQRWTPLSHRWAFAVVGVTLFGVTAALVWLMGSQVIGQISTLMKQLPEAIKSIKKTLGSRSRVWFRPARMAKLPAGFLDRFSRSAGQFSARSAGWSSQ